LARRGRGVLGGGARVFPRARRADARKAAVSGTRPSGDQARGAVTAAGAPPVAFEVFTRETDLWWRRGVKYRLAGKRPGVLAFEPGPGGRLFESFETGSGTRTFGGGRGTARGAPPRAPLGGG